MFVFCIIIIQSCSTYDAKANPTTLTHTANNKLDVDKHDKRFFKLNKRNANPKSFRTRRFTEELAANIQGGIRVTGLRYVYKVNELLYDIFGDSQTESKQELENVISDLKENTKKLKDEIVKYKKDSNAIANSSIEFIEEMEQNFKQDVENSIMWLISHNYAGKSSVLDSFTPTIKKFLIKELLSPNFTETNFT